MKKLFCSIITLLVLLFMASCEKEPVEPFEYIAEMDNPAPVKPASVKKTAPVLPVLVEKTTEEAVVEKPVLPAVSAEEEEKRLQELEELRMIGSCLHTWQTSQNSGDFDTYSRLYAPEFKGIKRTGENRYEFKRADWLDDRKTMGPFQVDIKDIQIEHQGMNYKISFIQNWKSERYEDTGPKQIIVKPAEDGRFFIIREELLKSTVLLDVRE